MRILFPHEPPGPWGDAYGHAAFALAAFAGMRRAEVLALRWGRVDLVEATLHIVEAWKDASQTTLGPPKWSITRETPMSDFLVATLVRLRDESVRVAPEDLVLAYDSGQVRGFTWWAKRFHAALNTAGIDQGDRRLIPHSFRHSLWTLALAQGLSPELAAASLGWTNQRTPRLYTHLRAEHGGALAAVADGIVDDR